MEIYNTFQDLTKSFILPRKNNHPNDKRLDGQPSGGNRNIAGKFKHNGNIWKVHFDTHYKPLMLAYNACKQGKNPFQIETKPNGNMSLVLINELRKLQNSKHKYLFVYFP